MKRIAFPDFGKEVQRPFVVAEQCYDCAEFHYGCKAWPTDSKFACADVNRLPDVMPGDCGQVFPPPRMHGRMEPRAGRVVTPKGTPTRPRCHQVDGKAPLPLRAGEPDCKTFTAMEKLVQPERHGRAPVPLMNGFPTAQEETGNLMHFGIVHTRERYRRHITGRTVTGEPQPGCPVLLGL